MYTISFYSFNDDPWRPLVVANVAAEMARRGRKVVVIDLDLEVPAIDRLLQGDSERSYPGLLEFICALRDSGSPEVGDYLCPPIDVGQNDGRIWVMAAGQRGPEYRSALASIDWVGLYEEGDGFSFFDQLITELQEAVEPDYVLVNCPRGYSILEGVGTRQLPDATVLLSRLDRESLPGLTEICRDIRSEAERGRTEDVRLHFAIVDAPTYVEDISLLDQRLAEYQRELGFEEIPHSLTRPPGTLLADHPLIVLDRPRSTTAGEYKDFVDNLIAANLQDAESALRWLRENRQDCLFDDLEFTTGQLSDLARTFGENSQVLLEVARTYIALDWLQEGLLLLDRCLEKDAFSSDALLERFQVHRRLGNRDAIDDLLAFLKIPGLGDAKTLQGLKELKGFDLPRFRKEINSSRVGSLDDVHGLKLASLLADNPEVEAPTEVLRRLVEIVKALRKRRPLPHLLPPDPNFTSYELITEGNLAKAIEYLETAFPDSSKLPVQAAFNLAMAHWAQHGKQRHDLLALVVERLQGERDPEKLTPSDCQMLSLAFWGIGKAFEAKHWLFEAVKRVDDGKVQTSYWRYGNEAPSSLFRDDCYLQEQMISGVGENFPFFFQRRKVSQSGK